MLSRIDAKSTVSDRQWIDTAAELQLTPSEAARITASLHGSLKLDEILRGCRLILGNYFALGQLCLVQHRANESTVTVYALADNADAPIIGPKIIALGPSRLMDCIIKQRELTVCLEATSDWDLTEREHLLLQSSEVSMIIYWPLQLRGRLKGVLVSTLHRTRLLTANQTAFLNYVASHLALAVDNSDTHYLERRRGRQLAIVSEVAKRAVVLEDLREFLQEAAQLIRGGFDYHVVQIWTIGSRHELALTGQARKSAGEEFAVQAIHPMVEECSLQDRILCSNNSLSPDSAGKGNQKTGSHLAVPIRLRERSLGVLWIESARLDAFPEEDISIMEGVASLIASAFDNLQTFTQARQSNQYMQAVLESANDRAILSTDIHGYVITSSVGAQSIFHIAQCEILGRDILTLFTDPRFQRQLSQFIHSGDRSILERNNLAQTSGRVNSYLDVTLQRVYNSLKQPVGFLCIVRDTTENVLLQQRLESLSITDDLTGLYNQRRFFTAVADEVVRFRRFNRRFSLCFFDLDGFKKYNDSQGHIRGDQALRDTADLIQRNLRSNVDVCYRYGGDEFTVIMPETVGHKALIVVERIRTNLSRHFQGQITASIGIAEFSGQMDAEELIEQADKAMYRAKAQGGNCICMSAPGNQEAGRLIE